MPSIATDGDPKKTEVTTHGRRYARMPAVFLGYVGRAIAAVQIRLNKVLMETKFWKFHTETALIESQRNALNKRLDAGSYEFEGNLTTRNILVCQKYHAKLHDWRE